jgi:hypothetical protein
MDDLKTDFCRTCYEAKIAANPRDPKADWMTLAEAKNHRQEFPLHEITTAKGGR